MKADAIQLDILIKNVNLEKNPPAKLVQLYAEYLQYTMKQNFEIGMMDREFFLIIDNLLKYPNKYFCGEITSDDFSDVRIRAWKLHDAEENLLRKNILRAIVSSLYEKSFEASKNNESYILIELYLSLLLEINAKYCEQFRIFLEKVLK
ncbi:hypothetical protein [Listeria farberi]|uniref:Uncharacterized protein n=1 Tax=Listeria farberi TaxID=2713500 RepID=A0A7X0ZG30_9LIST|nr:hypothetical protein [Listeria farberi]MBC1374387.1 hypothetical protein [Listeria farberi]MBC1380961.1 hypothetical protein [Listeria farberi]MBC2267197.1 hypothetical protein [Listeria farberi]MBC2286657.1 hypothetical protein [Listeria farberi]